MRAGSGVPRKKTKWYDLQNRPIYRALLPGTYLVSLIEEHSGRRYKIEARYVILL